MSFKYKWDINEYNFNPSSVSFTADDKALQGVLEDCCWEVDFSSGKAATSGYVRPSESLK